MVHATDVLERLAKDVKIVIKNISLAPTDNLHSILGDAADWKSGLGSLSEVAHFAMLRLRTFCIAAVATATP